MKLAWRCNQQPGGSWNIGPGASPKGMAGGDGPTEDVAVTEHDLAEYLRGVLHRLVVERDVVAHPLVVDVRPAVRSMMSSIQSVAGQPVAPCS